MGKKSKRVRGAAAGTTRQHQSTSSSSTDANVNVANKRMAKQPDDDADVEIADVLDEMEETRDNLRFQDPFEDEYEEEDVVSSDESLDDEKRSQNRDSSKVPPPRDETETRAWVPSLGLDSKNETLEIDLRAYRMHHALTVEWPSLSFDFVRDDFGGKGRTRFPHSLIAVSGTQAPPGEDNALTVMKMTDLCGTGSRRRRRRRDDDGDDDTEDSDSEDSDSDDDSEDDEEGGRRGDDPMLEHVSLPHEGGVNRVRVMPDHSSPSSPPSTPEFLSTKRIVATWSDVGAVNLYDLTPTLTGFERSSGRFSSSSSDALDDGDNTQGRRPFFTNDGHRTEGYALDWSNVNPGHLVSGDCSGEIDLYRPTESSFSVTRAAYGPTKKERKNKNKVGALCSVEDAQWSPTESTVFATGESGGVIRIYDTRRHGKAMLTTKATASPGTDVNVIGWNHMVSNLLCSGDDDGVFACWDLRTFGGGGGGGKKERGTVDPLARFAYDRGSPITSVEWHPTDESMVLVTDENYTYVYDLSVEADDDGGGSAPNTGLNGTPEGMDAIPPQLLFLHCGSEHTKEAHWHPQISSCVMTTALNGFSVFIPSNL